MSEIYWKIVSNVSVIIVMAAAGYCFYLFEKPFTIKMIHARIGAAVYVTTMILLYFIPYIFQNFVAYGAGVLISSVVLCLLDRRNYKQKIFLGITFAALRWLSSGISTVVYSTVSDLLFGMPFVYGNNKVQFFMYVCMVLLNFLVRFILLYSAIRVLLRVYQNKRDDLKTGEMIMLSAPGMMSTLIYVIESFYKELTGYEVLIELTIAEFISYCISYVSIIAVIYFYQKLKTIQEEEKCKALLFTQVENMKRYIYQTEQHYDKMRSLKHDIGNHIMVLESLYKKGEKKEANEYAKKLAGQLNSTLGKIKSGNPITDVILTEKYAEAEAKGIEFSSNFYFPKDTAIDIFDLSVLMNNAISNAVEAANGCEKPFVRICSYRKRNAYMLEVENSYTGKLNINDETGLPLTTKDKDGQHGLGLKNIKSIAKKYYGDIDIDYNNGRFKLSIMLITE